MYVVAPAQQLAYFLDPVEDGVEGWAVGPLDSLIHVGDDVDLVHPCLRANGDSHILEVPQHVFGDLNLRRVRLPMGSVPGDGNGVSGALHDAEVGGIVVLLVDPDNKRIDLVEDDDGFIMDATRCAEEGASTPGWRGV